MWRVGVSGWVGGRERDDLPACLPACGGRGGRQGLFKSGGGAGGVVAAPASRSHLPPRSCRAAHTPLIHLYPFSGAAEDVLTQWCSYVARMHVLLNGFMLYAVFVVVRC